MTLVNPQGRPIGGILQRWANQMQVASWRGTLVIDANTAPCQVWPWHPPACADITPTGTVYYAPSLHDPDIFYWELAHEFDARYLSDADRVILMQWLTQDAARMGIPPITVWWQMPPEYPASEEGNSGGEWFSAYYAFCALGSRANEDPRVCRLVNDAARRVDT